MCYLYCIDWVSCFYSPLFLSKILLYSFQSFSQGICFISRCFWITDSVPISVVFIIIPIPFFLPLMYALSLKLFSFRIIDLPLLRCIKKCGNSHFVLYFFQQSDDIDCVLLRMASNEFFLFNVLFSFYSFRIQTPVVTNMFPLFLKRVHSHTHQIIM